MEGTKKRVRYFNDIVGQTFVKNIVLNKRALNTLPKKILFEGEYGSGKSTMAELTALSLTCERGEIQPCLVCDSCRRNLAGLENDGIGSTVIKVNIAEVFKGKELQDLIHEVFKLEPIHGGNVVYIFEEMQALPKEKQTSLLEWFDKVKDGMFIFICTTEKYSLLDTLVSRMDLHLNFTKLSRAECLVLINKHCERLGLKMREIDKEFLVNATKSCARDIVHVLYSLYDLPDFAQVLRNYFGIIDAKHYINYLEQCYMDFASFILWLDTLESDVNIVAFWNGFCDFLRSSLYYIHGSGGGSVFTNREKGLIGKIIPQIPEDEIMSLLKYSHKRVRTVEDAQFRLITTREILNKPKTVAAHKVEAVRENRQAEEAAKDKGVKNIDVEIVPQVKVEAVLERQLADLVGNGVVYD